MQISVLHQLVQVVAGFGHQAKGLAQGESERTAQVGDFDKLDGIALHELLPDFQHLGRIFTEIKCSIIRK